MGPHHIPPVLIDACNPILRPMHGFRPIGLIQAAVGGTRNQAWYVGQWSDPPGLLAACSDVHNGNFSGGLSYGFLGMHYRGMIEPLLNTTVSHVGGTFLGGSNVGDRRDTAG